MDDQAGVKPTCASSYTAWTGLTLRCNGRHLRGNILRGAVHQAPYAGLAWTWYDEEADRVKEAP